MVGRSSRCHVVIEHESISRRHAELEIDDSRAVLRDLQSRNGSYVNERRVSTAEVFPGDRLRFGDVDAVLASTQPEAAEPGSDMPTPVCERRTVEKCREQLTKAQSRVLDQLLRGLSEKEIGVELRISENTVHHHVDAIRKVFDVDSCRELMALFVLPGLNGVPRRRNGRQ